MQNTKFPSLQQPSLDRFLSAVTQVVPFPQQMDSIDEILKSLYVDKMAGLLWFNGRLPKNYNQKFDYHINMDWPTEPPPDGIDQIKNMDEGDLEWIIRRENRSNHIQDTTIEELYESMVQIFMSGA